MRSLVLTALIAVCSAAKLDRAYLPPITAKTAGGSPGALQTPFAGQDSEGSGTFPKGSFTNEFQGVIVDAAAAGTRSSDPADTGLGAPRHSYGSQDSRVGAAAFRVAGSNQFGNSNKQLTPGSADTFLKTSFAQSSASGQVSSNPNAHGFNSQQNLNSFNAGAERPQAAQERVANTVRFESEVGPENFNYAFETDNGIAAHETGIATNGVQAQGAFSYTGDDGQVYSVSYTADEEGYKPQGDHLPTPPPIPEEILRSLEQNARDEAAGLIDDGSYDAKKYNEGGDYTKGEDNNGQYQHGSAGQAGIQGSAGVSSSATAFSRGGQSLASATSHNFGQGQGIDIRGQSNQNSFTRHGTGNDQGASLTSANSFVSGQSQGQNNRHAFSGQQASRSQGVAQFGNEQTSNENNRIGQQSFGIQGSSRFGSGQTSTDNKQNDISGRLNVGTESTSKFGSSLTLNENSRNSFPSHQTSGQTSNDNVQSSFSGHSISGNNGASRFGTSQTSNENSGNRFTGQQTFGSQGTSRFSNEQTSSNKNQNGISGRLTSESQSTRFNNEQTLQGTALNQGSTSASASINQGQRNVGFNRDSFGQPSAGGQLSSQTSAFSSHGQRQGGFNKQTFGQETFNQLNDDDSAGASTNTESGIIKDQFNSQQFNQKNSFNTQSDAGQYKDSETSFGSTSTLGGQIKSTFGQQKTSQLTGNQKQINKNGYLPPFGNEPGSLSNSQTTFNQQRFGQTSGQASSSIPSIGKPTQSSQQTSQFGQFMQQQSTTAFKPLGGFGHQPQFNNFKQSTTSSSNDQRFGRPTSESNSNNADGSSSFNLQKFDSKLGQTNSDFDSASAVPQPNGQSGHTSSQSSFLGFNSQSISSPGANNKFLQQHSPINSQQSSNNFPQAQFNVNGQSDHQFASSTQTPAFSQTSASSHVSSSGIISDKSYEYKQPSMPFNKQTDRFSSSSSNQFNRLTQQQTSTTNSQNTAPHQFQSSQNLGQDDSQESVSNQFSANSQNEVNGAQRENGAQQQLSQQFNAQSSKTQSLQTRPQITAQSSAHFQGTNQQNTRLTQQGFLKQTTAIPQSFKPLGHTNQQNAHSSTTQQQQNQFQRFIQQTGQRANQPFGSTSSQAGTNSFESSRDTTQATGAQSTQDDNSVQSQQYDGEIYQYNKPEQMLPAPNNKDQDSSSTSISTQGINRPIESFKQRSQSTSRFSAQSVAGKGEVFGGPRKPPSFDAETGYHY